MTTFAVGINVLAVDEPGVFGYISALAPHDQLDSNEFVGFAMWVAVRAGLLPPDAQAVRILQGVRVTAHHLWADSGPPAQIEPLGVTVVLSCRACAQPALPDGSFGQPDGGLALSDGGRPMDVVATAATAGTIRCVAYRSDEPATLWPAAGGATVAVSFVDFCRECGAI